MAPVHSWEQFRKACSELVDWLKDEKNPAPFDLIVVDTIDVLADYCNDYVLKGLGGDRKGFLHASDFEYGKGWAAVAKEFQLRIAALCSLGLPVLLVSHAKDSQVKTRTGEITVKRPDIDPKGARKWLDGFVDLILYAEIHETPDGQVRQLRTAPSENYQAGGRVPRGMNLPDPRRWTGRRSGRRCRRWCRYEREAVVLRPPLRRRSTLPVLRTGVRRPIGPARGAYTVGGGGWRSSCPAPASTGTAAPAGLHRRGHVRCIPGDGLALGACPGRADGVLMADMIRWEVNIPPHTLEDCFDVNRLGMRITATMRIGVTEGGQPGAMPTMMIEPWQSPSSNVGPMTRLLG